MADREKVVKALRACSPDAVLWCQAREKAECDYSCDYCVKQMCEDAADLLTPRILTLEELMGFDGAFFIEYNPSMISREANWAMFHFMDEKQVHIWRPRLVEHYAITQYGVTWRCWNVRPSQAEMEAMPWNGSK